MPEEPLVVIIGAGFGGVWAAKALSQARARVLLIDRNNYHTFLPLLYQVAAAELKPEEIAYPVRGILRGIRNARFMMDDVRAIDPVARTVETTCRTISYDYLLVAAGSETDFFGVPGAAEHSFPLKNLEQGIKLRNHILTRFERAMHMRDRLERKKALTFVIAGGGSTGVEFAGALAELVYGPLVRDYPEIDPSDVSVMIIEGGDRLLPGLPAVMGEYARKRLGLMGVKVLLRSLVSRVSPKEVCLKDDTTLPAETVVWTAGIRGAGRMRNWGFPATRGDRVTVMPSLQVAGHPEVFVAGDLAWFEDGGRPLPMTAPVAMQQGLSAARNIMLMLAGQEPVPFHYRDRGAMVTIGRNSAVANVGGRIYTGFPAWLLWLGVHLFNLIGFPNRFFVFASWSFDYFFYERTVRLILPYSESEDAAACKPPG